MSLNLLIRSESVRLMTFWIAWACAIFFHLSNFSLFNVWSFWLIATNQERMILHLMLSLLWVNSWRIFDLITWILSRWQRMRMKSSYLTISSFNQIFFRLWIWSLIVISHVFTFTHHLSICLWKSETISMHFLRLSSFKNNDLWIMFFSWLLMRYLEMLMSMWQKNVESSEVTNLM